MTKGHFSKSFGLLIIAEIEPLEVLILTFDCIYDD